MKKNILFSILCVVLIFLESCERESLDFSKPIENTLSKDVAEIKAGWEAFTFNAPLAGLPMNEMVVDWENPVQRDSVTGTAYEFPITQEFPTVLNSDRFEGESLELVVYDGGERLYRVVRMLHTENSAEASTFLEPSGLDGTVHVYDLEGVNILVMAYEKGALVASAVEEGLEDVPEVGLSKTARCSTRKSASWASLKRSYNSNCNGGGGYNRVRVEHYTDWFNHRGNGQWEFQRSEHTGTTYEYVYSSGAGYGGATIYRETARPYGGSGAAFNSWWRQNSVFFNTTPEGYEKKYKIFNNLTGKADCVYKKLKIHSGNFRKAIRKFDPEFPVTHLTFRINNGLPKNNYGRTLAPSNYNVTIEMSNTQLATISDLGGAVSFAHELIHAEIFRKMLSAAQRGDLDPDNMTRQQQLNYVQSLKDNFPGIYDYYYKRSHPSWNHNMMAQHYRDVIADIAEEFDNKKLSRTEYEDVAWAGLRVIENFTNSIAWDNLSASDKSRVEKNLQKYFLNGPNNCK